MTRTVLVTGGSSGIGRAVAARFVADGADVVVTGRRAQLVETTAQEIGAAGVVCDATDPQAVEALAARFDTLDVLVNAAGGLGSAQPRPGAGALETVLAEWQADLDGNLLSAVLTTTALKPVLAPGGTAIAIGTIGSERRGGSYGAAKAALTAWYAMLSADLGPRGVTANVVSPGYIADTGFFRGAMTDAREQTLIAETHTKRAGAPHDIAETVFFLASPGARQITGQTIHVNGGAFTTR
ncbi:short-chain dehydrogenase/reductase SDR [Catenulispora acidiphila DSM 44928]|uniref:Short-chain dehydrogenase/reductase SDR n=1 Tax=Catenulispora acidiphila (strain DSM 44928 / JCM 14897 / NBRC 102108 / NRRL B-24433 / ID139908) TaxID=479433 RepID=C7QB73_CATAD|nr:SDR family oxidoreductase [Catenulispora acidiphila]ACU76364.1 short-chain dehydrogenase/reductase SDR [Catenulispora acidiphila DSM 44928]